MAHCLPRSEMPVLKAETLVVEERKPVNVIVRVCPGKCIHDYQDLVYGPGKRLMTSGLRCTVCGTKQAEVKKATKLVPAKTEGKSGKKGGKGKEDKGNKKGK